MAISFWYCRTSPGAEIDLVTEKDSNEIWAIEIKKSTAPTISKGFYIASDDIKATQRWSIAEVKSIPQLMTYWLCLFWK